MKSVRKFKDTAKAVAGSALLVGATLTGAAGFAAAQDSGSLDLGDYPAPFVDENGEVQSTVVVGESASTVDVVGAINIAGSLGQDAATEEEVSVGGSAASWSATNGATLDNTNNNLFFQDNVDKVRSILTEDELEALETTTFSGDSDQDVTQYLRVGSNAISFEKVGDDEEETLLVDNPVVDGDSYLYQLEANFGQGIEFTDSSQEDDKNDDVYGEEISMFGETFTISQDSFTSGNSGELILYGNSENVQISNGESATVTVDGEEHTIEVQAVNGEGVVYSVDGESAVQDNVGETFDIGDTTVRIDSKIDLQDDSGSAEFSVGSEELVLSDGEPVQNSDGDDIEGTQVSLSGNNFDSTVDNGVELSNININVGAADSDENYVAAGEAFEDPVFDLAFQFEGLNPDASEDGEEISVSASGDNTLSASFSSGDDSTSVEFLQADSGSQSLADEDGDSIIAVEGNAVTEDEYLVTDAGDFTHLWEVTDVSRDSEEATVEMSDVVSGADVELDIDSSGSNYAGSEVIDGQTYHFHLDGDASSDSEARLKAAWGTGAEATSDGVNTGNSADGVTTAFPTLKTDSGARVGFYDPDQSPEALAIGTGLNDITSGDNLYWYDEGGDGDIGSNDALWIDNADDGIFNANGQIVSANNPGSSLQDIIDPTFEIELDSPESDTSNQLVEFESSGRIQNPKTSQQTIGLESGTSSSNGQIVEASSTTGQYYIAQSSQTDGQSSAITLVGDDADTISGTDLAGSSLNVKEVASSTQAGDADSDAVIDGSGATSFSSTGSDTIAIDDGADTGVNLGTVSEGQPLAIDTDADGDLNDLSEDGVVFVVADETGSDQNTGTINNLNVVGRNGASISIADGDPVYTIGSWTDASNDDVDDYYLGSSSNIVNSINDAFSQTISAEADHDYNNNNLLRIQSDSASENSYVEIFSSSGTGTSVEGNSYLDISSEGNGVESRKDLIQHGSTSDSTVATTEVTDTSYLKTPSGSFSDGDMIVEDDDGSGDFTSADEVVGTSSSGNIQYWSSDSSQTSGVSKLNSNLPSTPGLVVIEGEDDSDSQESYVVTGSLDDDEVTVDSPDFTDDSKRQTLTLESDSDVTAGYDVFGAYSEYNSDDQGSFSLTIPSAQATAGVAVTSEDGEVSTSGSAGSVTTQTPAGWPGAAALDSDSSADQTKTSENTILVGGPAVNTLTQELADNGQTMTRDEYSEGDQLVQLVEDSFSEGVHSLVVAGYSGENTRTAASYISNYGDHSEELSGQSQVNLATQ